MEILLPSPFFKSLCLSLSSVHDFDCIHICEFGPKKNPQTHEVYAWCWLHGKSGGLGIRGSWVQILFGCWINTRWGWLSLSSFWYRQNEYQLAGILCQSDDLTRIVPCSPGDCLGSINALLRIWSQWMDGWMKSVFCICFILCYTFSVFLLNNKKNHKVQLQGKNA